ncbi:MAG: DUF5916 domain-containing protein [Gemmatimonadaceae bacterium]
MSLGLRLFVLLMSAAALAAPCASAPAQQSSTVHTTASRIRLDGVLDERDWALADSIYDFHQKEPTEGGAPSERTVVRLLATPNGLAVGWWAYDRDVSSRVRTQLRRDATLRSDDYVSMGIDGLSDQRSAFYFRVNSNGAMWDGEHVDIETGNEEWDGIWDVRTSVDEAGWYAEMLIPWATLRYRRDVAAMGMNFRRFLPRTNEEVLWRAWKRTQGLRFLEEAGAINGFSALPPRARAEFRPFVLGQASAPEREYLPNGDANVLRSAAGDAAVGLDVKLPVTPTLTADLTAFPDFAQAEVDRQIVNLSRFPLFFPEQRPFFTEGASIFQFGRLQQAQMFYSRRIGLGANGTPIEIPVGARMQGRAGQYQLGFLAVKTGDDEQATDLVARVRRDILGRGFVGAMSTFSDSRARPGSLAAGVDFNVPFIVRGGSNLIFLGNAAWNRDSVGGASGAHYRIMVDYPNDHADIVTRFDRVDAAYDPALGFVLQSGIQRFSGSTRLTPRPQNATRIRRWEFDALTYDVVWDLDGRLDNAQYSMRPLGALLQSGDRLELNLIRREDRPTVDFDLVSGATIAAGEYAWNRAQLKYTGANIRAFVVEATAETGQFYDGDRHDLTLAALWRLQPHLELRVDVIRNDIVLPADEFVVNTVRFRGDYAFTPRLTATLFAQMDDQSDRAALNARMRWTTSPGSDLYVVWNSTWPLGLERGIPWERPIRGGLVAKYVRFFRT